MNDDRILDEHENESPETVEEKVRVPRRARRTLAPFSPEEIAKSPEETLKEVPFASEESFSAKAEKEPEVPEEVSCEDVPEKEEPVGETLSERALYEEKAVEKSEEILSPAGNVFDWVKSFLFSLATVIFIFTLLFRGVTVNGGSMLPTLEDKEYLIISNLFYTPETGDIVVVQSPHYKNGTEPLIKRIIATEGQTVKINFITWQVWVDGVLLEEDYILEDGNSTMNCEDMIPDENGEAQVTVAKNCIFVMGDHRNDSLDSRSESVGQIDERYIMGRVVLRITPFERFGKVD